MRRKKIEACIRGYLNKIYPDYVDIVVTQKVKEECANLEEVNTWVLLRTLENDMQFVRPHLEALMGTVDTMWSLPPFKPFRGKR